MPRRLRPLNATLAVLLTACGGGGGGGGGGGDAPAAPPGNTSAPDSLATFFAPAPAPPANNAAFAQCPTAPAVGTGAAPAGATLSGRVSFARIPFFSGLGFGLEYQNPQTLPARGVVVEAVVSGGGACEGEVLATALTDGDGWYGLTLDANRTVCVRARAQLYRAGSPAWNLAVVDNTDGHKLYALADGQFATAAAMPRRDLHASTGWNGSFTGQRMAAPFAILDTACKGVNQVLSAQPDADFGAMTFRWSVRNTDDDNGTLEEGKIGGAFFSPSARAIYLRGDAAVNTDEYDEPVIAHEFGHFVTHQFARSDSPGGSHSLFENLDPALAFDEGWATAFGALALGSPLYRDSREVATPSSPQREFYFDIETGQQNWPQGWYSEASVQKLLYDLGDGPNDEGVELGFAGLWQVLRSAAYRQDESLATVFSFGRWAKEIFPAAAPGIAGVLDAERINGDIIDSFGQGETHGAPPVNPADPVIVLPIYSELQLNVPQQVCSRMDYGIPNKLANTRYLRFTAAQTRTYRVSVSPQDAQGAPGVEWRQSGELRQQGEAARGVSLRSQLGLTAGATYVLGVYQVGNVIEDGLEPAGNRCFTVGMEAL